MAIGRLQSVSASSGHVLKLVWDDGHAAQVDLSSLIAETAALSPLVKPSAFRRASLSEDGWSVAWPNGVDFGSGQLRRWADEQAGEAMPLQEFRDWMARHVLSLSAAAAALGLSRRMIAYYASGERPIPRTVMLATEGWSARAKEEA